MKKSTNPCPPRNKIADGFAHQAAFFGLRHEAELSLGMPVPLLPPNIVHAARLAHLVLDVSTPAHRLLHVHCLPLLIVVGAHAVIPLRPRPTSHASHRPAHRLVGVHVVGVRTHPAYAHAAGNQPQRHLIELLLPCSHLYVQAARYLTGLLHLRRRDSPKGHPRAQLRCWRT